MENISSSSVFVEMERNLGLDGMFPGGEKSAAIRTIYYLESQCFS